MTTDSPHVRPAENGAMLAAAVAFVVVAAVIAALVRPVLDQLFFGYTPHHLATAIGIAAGAIAARLGYRRVRLSA
jgi:hypothetical protein